MASAAKDNMLHVTQMLGKIIINDVDILCPTCSMRHIWVLTSTMMLITVVKSQDNNDQHNQGDHMLVSVEDYGL